jgi:sensor histidine kinase regulating citrate/malate metabolism
MLANLLDNAMRHTPKDVHIEVSLTREHSQIVATVADNDWECRKKRGAGYSKGSIGWNAAPRSKGTGSIFPWSPPSRGYMACN